ASSRQLERQMVIAGILIGLVFAVLGWLLAGRITRPLAAIARSAERIRRGETGVEIPPLSRGDELGVLAESLRRLTASLRDAKESAESASRAKDHFLAMLSHELRTPLSPMLFSAQYLLSGDLPDYIRSDIEMILRNAQLEARLIDDLLDLTRIT